MRGISNLQNLPNHHQMSVRAAIALAGATWAVCGSTIHNDPKRNFYEDEQNVVPVPGTVTPSSPAQLEILGPRSVVNGVTVRSSGSVESFFKSVRESLYGAYTSTQEYLNEGKHKYYATERQVTGTVSAFHNKLEDLLPNSIYIVIAALSGNILARRRGIISRTVVPIGLGLASFKYFLPQTFSNIMGFAWKVEQRSLPELANSQVLAMEKAENLVLLLEKSAASGQQKVNSSVEALRRKISDVTGLNIDEEVSKK